MSGIEGDCKVVEVTVAPCSTWVVRVAWNEWQIKSTLIVLRESAVPCVVVILKQDYYLLYRVKNYI